MKQNAYQHLLIPRQRKFEPPPQSDFEVGGEEFSSTTGYGMDQKIDNLQKILKFNKDLAESETARKNIIQQAIETEDK